MDLCIHTIRYEIANFNLNEYQIRSTAITREINASSEQTIATVNAGDETQLSALRGVRHADETKNRQSTRPLSLYYTQKLLCIPSAKNYSPSFSSSSSDPQIKIRPHKTK